MNNTNQQLYAIYKNISSFYQYRRVVSLNEELTQDQFIKIIQKDKYILLSAVDRSVVDTNGEVDQKKLSDTKELVISFNEKSESSEISIMNIVIVYPGTDCESKRANMMKIINHVRFPRAEIFIITPTKVSSGVAKGVYALSSSKEHSKHTFKLFTYSLLSSVLPEYELVPKYEILTPDQIAELGSWYITPDSIPKIFENDPQMVWIGANVGDVVKYVYASEVTIEAIGYCHVVRQ